MLLTIGMIVSAQNTMSLTVNAYSTTDYVTKENKEINLIYDLEISKDYMLFDEYYLMYDKGSTILSDMEHFFFKGIDDGGNIMEIYLEADSRYGFILFPKLKFAIFIEILKWERLK